MKKKFFLIPTKAKLMATAILLIAVYVAQTISDFIIEQIIPQQFIEAMLEAPMQDFMEANMESMMTLGFQAIAIMFIVYAIILYIAASIITTLIREKKS